MEKILDIEDIVKTGHENKICPYYVSRYSIPSAELVALPYNILLRELKKGKRELGSFSFSFSSPFLLSKVSLRTEFR
jgi:hypothetical protein